MRSPGISGVESQRRDALLKDEQAGNLVRQFDVDFTRLIRKSGMDPVCTVMRVRQFDRFAQAFIGQYPRGCVVDIGCGLTTRFGRIDNRQLTWVGLDLPEVIDIRRKLLPEEPRTRLISRSVFDFTWLEEITSPVLFLAEGVLPYLKEEDIKSLMLKAGERFPGSEFVFDAINSFSMKAHRLDPTLRKALLEIHWVLDDSRVLETWGSDIHVLEEWKYFDQHERAYIV
jgi:O-methyltransferase involved in polyketide biosynthesis